MPLATQGTSQSDVLRAFAFHGVRFQVRGKEAVADCPFCGKEGKFAITRDGLWRCWVCQEGNDNDKGGGGNLLTFLRCLWRRSYDRTNGATAELAKGRKFLFPETPLLWGLCLSITTRDWLIPAYSLDGKKLEQLYRWQKNDKGKMELRPTPGLGHRIFGTQFFDPKKPTTDLCEGPWDGMALWEVLRSTKEIGDELTETGNEASSLLSETSVLAVPGCGSIGSPFEKWTSLFSGKRLRLWFDSDHPTLREGRLIPGAGIEAAKRSVRILSTVDQPPKEVSYAKWGEEGYDLDLPSGFDVRDFLGGAATSKERIVCLPELLRLQSPVPPAWLSNGTLPASKPGSVKLMPSSCHSWSELQNAWRKAMSNWDSSGLDKAMLVSCAAILSTRTPDDPVWIKMIGPPGCGKSTICEALAVADKWTYPLSLMTGFHSGYKSDKEGTEDHGLIPKIRDKTLIVKDATILIDSPMLKKTISEARDLFDGSSRAHYGHGISRKHENIRMTFILCGTKALYGADLAELGERFLTCTIMEKINEEHEREICLRNAYIRARGITENGDGSPASMRSKEKTEAMRLTAGFINWLRENDGSILHGIKFSHEHLETCTDLGVLTAHLRARPSRKQEEESDTRELASRVVSQLTGLMLCTAGVLGKKEVDHRVMGLIRSVATDTMRGATLNIVKILSSPKVVEVGGLCLSPIANLMSQSDDRMRSYLRFLRAVGVVEVNQTKTVTRWRLTEKIRELYDRVKQNKTPGS